MHDAADALATLTARVEELDRERDEAVSLNSKYAWERDKAREERDAAERRSEALLKFWKSQLPAEVKLAKAVEALRRTMGSLDALTSMLNPSNLPTGAEQQLEATVEQARRARATIEELEGE